MRVVPFHHLGSCRTITKCGGLSVAAIPDVKQETEYDMDAAYLPTNDYVKPGFSSSHP